MEVKSLCARISVDLFKKVADAKTEAGLTTNEYVTQLLTEYYAWKENGGNIMARKTENTRTLAFQIPEELFQRIKEHLEKESKRRGIRLTQRDFVLGLIEQALEEAERESARTEETAAGQSDGAGARSEAGAGSPDGEPESEEDGEEAEEADSAESAENAPADAVEDADSANESQPLGRELNAP